MSDRIDTKENTGVKFETATFKKPNKKDN